MSTKFSVLVGLFNKYPTGKMILRLDDEVIMEIIHLDQLYFLYVDSDIKRNPYVEARLESVGTQNIPEEGWEFLRPDGTIMEILQKTVYYTKDVWEPNTCIFHGDGPNVNA